jgi:prepilin-type N-terminal cleavage/methylation domain-containing protein
MVRRLRDESPLDRRRRSSGFTLMELLIVMALMLVALLGLLGLQIVAVRANGNARALTEATVLAQDRIESLERTPFAQLPATGTVVEPQLGPQGVAVAGGPYTRTTTTNRGASQANLRVQIAWVGSDGRAHGVAFNTVRSP